MWNIILFNDFMITMPNNEKYSFDASGDSVTFYLWAAQQEGYGGELVTIKAYDVNDDSYKNLQALAPGAKVINGERFSASVSEEKLKAWADGIK